MCLVGVVIRRYIDFLKLLIPTPFVSALFCSSIPTFCSFFYVFRSCKNYSVKKSPQYLMQIEIKIYYAII